MPQDRILMGVFGRPHGVRGLLRVVSYAAEPSSLTRYGTLSDERGRRFVLTWRGDGVAAVAELVDGTRVPVEDRDAAARLTNTKLYVDRAALPAPADDEFYLADLIGLEAFGADGGTLGRVVQVHDYGAGASLEIARDGAAPLLLPFTRACVPEIDLPHGKLIAALPAEIVVPESGEEAAA